MTTRKSKDRLTRERRSWNMSRIRGKNTTPEKIVRSILHRAGYRFRLHVRRLPGNPDIVLPKHRTVVFVHGCFWHRHKGCRNCTTPTNRREWWVGKLDGNAARDRTRQALLRKLGWRSIVVRECQTAGAFGAPHRHITRRKLPQAQRDARFLRSNKPDHAASL